MFATPCSILAFFTVVYLPSLVRSECECGYVVDNTLYTDLLESDFLHADSVTGDWQAQEYTVTPDVSRGPYGKHASPNNVVSNPTKNKDDWSGEGTKGGDAGVQLIVRGGIPDDKLIPSAELVTIREDLYYGSYRTNVKLTGTNGTCAAFFWVCRPWSRASRAGGSPQNHWLTRFPVVPQRHARNRYGIPLEPIQRHLQPRQSRPPIPRIRT